MQQNSERVGCSSGIYTWLRRASCLYCLSHPANFQDLNFEFRCRCQIWYTIACYQFYYNSNLPTVFLLTLCCLQKKGNARTLKSGSADYQPQVSVQMAQVWQVWLSGLCRHKYQNWRPLYTIWFSYWGTKEKRRSAPTKIIYSNLDFHS